MEEANKKKEKQPKIYDHLLRWSSRWTAFEEQHCKEKNRVEEKAEKKENPERNPKENLDVNPELQKEDDQEESKVRKTREQDEEEP